MATLLAAIYGAVGSRAGQMLRHVADQLRQKWPKPTAFIDDSETDVLSHLDFPEQHRTKVHSTNLLERLNKEVKRRADVVGIFPNEASDHPTDRGPCCWNKNDEWQLQHRYMQLEAMAELVARANEAETRAIPIRGMTLRATQPALVKIHNRQTAASTASMPDARPWRRGQAPQPRTGAPKPQGLTTMITVVAPSP